LRDRLKRRIEEGLDGVHVNGSMEHRLAGNLNVSFDGVDGDALLVLTAALLVGTPILSLLGAIGAALTLGLRAGGSLLALLILPLYVPVLIFGAGAVDAARAGLGADANISLLGAGLLVAIVGAPFAAAAAVRIALD